MKKITIIGGGAAGFFAALRAGELIKQESLPIEVHLFEGSSDFLRKVKISGGGRCNVTHAEFNTREFCKNYPRGSKELLSAFSQFQAEDTVRWFQDRAVQLKAEGDGRMFPTTNKSETIINLFLSEAEKLGIHLHKNRPVHQINKSDQGFHITFFARDSMDADCVMLATGSANVGYSFAESLGHTISERAPSLFSFKIADEILKDGAGTSFEKVLLTLKTESGKIFLQRGPILITHWGLSGPAILKISAFAARELKADNYKGTLYMSWLGYEKEAEVTSLLLKLKKEHAKSFLQNGWPTGLTKRFWGELLTKISLDPSMRWCDLTKDQIVLLTQNLYAMPLHILGQNRFKDEFVECGGVNLKEIYFKSMESKITEGLYFGGELLDIDGITGGFNFQNAWTTGYIAGTNMVRKLEMKVENGF